MSKLATSACCVVWLVSFVVANSVIAQVLPLAIPESVGLSSKKLQAVRDRIAEEVKDGQLEGMVVVVARNGKVVMNHACGYSDVVKRTPMRTDSIFRIYSMTKPITCAAAMILVERGKLGLDEPVAKYLPAFRNVKLLNGKPPKRGPMIRDLLRQTSGHSYPYFETPVTDHYVRVHDDHDTLAKNVRRYASVPLLYEPGSQFSYGFSIDILGAVIEVVSKTGLDDFLAKNLFVPLDMMDTGYHVPPMKRSRLVAVHRRKNEKLTIGQPFDRLYDRPPTFRGGGLGLVSTPQDYLRFCQMLLNGGILGNTRILGESTVAMMTSNQLPDETLPMALQKGNPKYANVYSATEDAVLENTGYGFGFGVNTGPNNGADRRDAFWWGGAAGTGCSISPRDEMIVLHFRQILPAEERFSVSELVYGAIK